MIFMLVAHLFPLNHHCQVYSIKWDFSHFDEALQSGSLLPKENSEKTRIYCFGCTEPQMIPQNDTTTVVPIPVIVAVQTDVPLPEKLGLNSVQMQTEQIVDMQRFKMGWMPLSVPKPRVPAGGAISKRRRANDPRVWGLCCSQASKPAYLCISVQEETRHTRGRLADAICAVG